METGNRVKKQAKKKVKTTNMQQARKYVSNLRELHKVEEVLLKGLDKCMSEKGCTGSA